MRDVVSWHSSTHGSSVRLVSGRTDLIERFANSCNVDSHVVTSSSSSSSALNRCCPVDAASAAGSGGGIAFSARPVKPGQKVCIHVRQRRKHAYNIPGSLRIGFTQSDPATLDPDQLPPYVIPDLTDQNGYWARAVGHAVRHLSRVTVWYSGADGSVHWEVDGERQKTLIERMDTSRTLWLMVDLYPPVAALKLVPPDSVPVDIMTRGPSAVAAYQLACRSPGSSTTVPSNRIHVVLVGQDKQERRDVKQCLSSTQVSNSGRRMDSYQSMFDLTCSSIDLSASYRYSQSHSISSENIASVNSNRNTPCTANSEQMDDDERCQAIACNLLLELIGKEVQQLAAQYSLSLQSSAATTRLSGAQLVQNKFPSTQLQNDEEGDDKEVTESQPNVDTDPDVPRQQSPAAAADNSDALASTNSVDQVGGDVTRRSNSTTNYAIDELLAGQPERVIELFHQLMTSLSTNSDTAMKPADNQTAADCVVNFDVSEIEDDVTFTLVPQVFMSDRAVYVFVFDLRRDLTCQVPATGSFQTDTVTDCLNNDFSTSSMRYQTISTLEFFNFWLQCIHTSAAINTSPDNMLCLSPPVLVVGTHCSELDSNPDQRLKMAEAQFERLRQFVSGKPYEQHVKQYLAIDSRQLVEQQENEVKCCIERLASHTSSYGEHMPYQWLLCEQALNKLVRLSHIKFCSLAQLQELAHDEGIQKNDNFSTWIHYCHDRGIVHCDFPSTSAAVIGNRSSSSGNDVTVVLQPTLITESCRTLLSTEANCCFKGILYERLLNSLWADNIEQKSIILKILDRSDFIAKRVLPSSKTISSGNDKKQGASYIVPCCMPQLSADFEDFYIPHEQDVVFYVCFSDFLPDCLFYRLIARMYRWSQSLGGDEPLVYSHHARFFLDNEHDFVVELLSGLLRIKISVLRVADVNDADNNHQSDDHTTYTPKPYAPAKVRNFIESTLGEFRETWIRHLSYHTSVRCSCGRPCSVHHTPNCAVEDCLHFLDLDVCLSNKVICCEYRRVSTLPYRNNFPAVATNSGPILPDPLLLSSEATDLEMPGWVKSSAKLLNGGSEGQDWLALAQKLGYKQQILEKFSYDLNPGLSLLTNWIISSGNTALSVDILMSCLEQMNRLDIVEVIQKGQEIDVEPAQIFISYQWDSQDEATVLRDVLEKNGFTCWMDIGQMGGGDHLYNKIYDGIKHCKVVLACLSVRYITSHHCTKEISLADLLHKPIIPVWLEQIPWPPGGAMSLIFAPLVYINLKGVGGHGGSGIHADIDDKYREVVMRVSVHTDTGPHPPRPYVSLSPSVRTKTVTGGGRSTTTSGREQQQQQQRQHQQVSPVRYETQSTTASNLPRSSSNASAAAADPSQPQQSPGGGRVQQVAVQKCTVCTLL